MDLQPFTFIRHYKGGIYRILSQATHSETGEEHIVYYALEGGKQWVRPLAMFNEMVDYEGKQVQRFEVVDIDNLNE